jgi:hypothetical protein
MGKSKNTKFEKSKFSREKTMIYDEADQEARDTRIAAEKSIRTAERQQNVKKTLLSGEEEVEVAEVKKPKEPRPYLTDYMETSE